MGIKEDAERFKKIRENHRKYVAERMKDPVFAEKKRKYNRERYRRLRDAYIQLQKIEGKKEVKEAA